MDLDDVSWSMSNRLDAVDVRFYLASYFHSHSLPIILKPKMKGVSDG